MKPQTLTRISNLAIYVRSFLQGYYIYCDADRVTLIEKLARADGLRCTHIALETCTKIFAH